jgi:hypothetical protein
VEEDAHWKSGVVEVMNTTMFIAENGRETQGVYDTSLGIYHPL